MTKAVVLPIGIFVVKSDYSVLVVSCAFDRGKSVSNCFWECSKYQFCTMKVEKKRTKMLLWQQCDVFVVFLPLVKTWRPRQEIRFVVRISRFMMKRKMILSKFSEPAGLSTIDFLWLSEVLKVLMIGPYFEYFICANKIVPPFFQSKHNRKHLFVVNLVIALCFCERFRKVCDGVPFIVLEL